MRKTDNMLQMRSGADTERKGLIESEARIVCNSGLKSQTAAAKPKPSRGSVEAPAK